MRVVLFLLFFVAAYTAAGQPAPEQRNISGVVTEIMNAAEKGDAEAQFYLGERYYFGRGLPQDYEKAATWFLRSAEQGYSEAQWYIGKLYYRGEGVLKDLRQARSWFERCVDLEQAECYSSLGEMYWYGHTVPVNFEKAKHLFNSATKKGDGWAFWALGQMHVNGDGVPKSNKKALEYFTRGAQRGALLSIMALANAYKEGLIVEKNDIKALQWFRIAAKKGDDEALAESAELEKLLKPDEIEQAKKLEADWARLRVYGLWDFKLEIIEEFNFDVAAFEQKAGIDVEAEKRLQQSIDKYCGASDKCSNRISLADLKKLADQGNQIFQNNYGVRLYENASSKQQKNEAFKYLLSAAKSGSAHAQVTVGWIYLHGLLGIRDTTAAFKWNMKGALQGEPEGANNVAFQYENGIGVQKSVEKAKEWYVYAAARGSQIALGALRHLSSERK